MSEQRVERIGDTMRRPVYAWSPAVHELLKHLESVGYPYSPRLLGFDEDGREIVTFLDGESGPDGWAPVVEDRGLRAMARMLRDYHAAVAEFRPTLIWARGEQELRAGEVICHGDFGPWNLAWRDGLPVGVFDFDYAGPGRPVDDVVYALEYVAPFREDETCLRWLRYPSPPDRRRRIEIFADAYGLTSTDGLVDGVIEQQIATHELVLRLASEGVEPQATWVAGDYVEERTALIQWSRDHRDELV